MGGEAGADGRVRMGEGLACSGGLVRDGACARDIPSQPSAGVPAPQCRQRVVGQVNRITQIAVLGAFAFVLMYLEVPLPTFPVYLKYEPGDIPALIAAFALGPVSGIAVEVVKAVLINMFRSGGVGGPFGIFMNLLAGVSLVAVAGSYYKVEHTKAGAVKSLIFGVGAMTVVMIVANILLTPIFYGIPRDTVVGLILPALLPFNLIKGLTSSILAYLVYKRVRVPLYELITDHAAW